MHHQSLEIVTGFYESMQVNDIGDQMFKWVKDLYSIFSSVCVCVSKPCGVVHHHQSLEIVTGDKLVLIPRAINGLSVAAVKSPAKT